jgi:hypothetical protein
MGPDPEDTVGRYTFPCGAWIVGHRGSMPLSKKGRVRLIVHGGDGQKPRHADGSSALCLIACPKREQRRLTRGWLEGSEKLTTLTTCLATWSYDHRPGGKVE